MNAKSSRSHTVFQILLESTNVNADGIYTVYIEIFIESQA